MSVQEVQRGIIVHVYGTHRYGILNLVPENAMVYFRVDKMFQDEEEIKDDDVALSSLLSVNSHTVLADCENILRINPRKNFANVELRVAQDRPPRLHCVTLDYSLFMGGLASSQLDAEAGKKRRRRKRNKSESPRESPVTDEADNQPEVEKTQPLVREETKPKIPVVSAGHKTNGHDTKPTTNENKPVKAMKVPPVLSISNIPSKPLVRQQSLEVVKPVTPPPATVTPPTGYINLDGTIRSVHPNNTNFHTVSFKFKKDVLVGAFYMQYVAINGSRIRSDELDKIRGLLKVGMPVFVIHFKVRNSSDRNIPYLAVVNFRSEVLYSMEWKRKPVDGIAKPIATKAVVTGAVSKATWSNESVWDIVTEKDIPTRSKTFFSSPVKVNTLTNEKAPPALPDVALEGVKVSGNIERFNSSTNRGVASFKYNNNVNMARFTLKQITCEGNVMEMAKYVDHAKVGMKVSLQIKNSPLGAEFKYEGDGIVNIAKIPSETETFPNDKIFLGFVVETISNEGVEQPRIVSINMSGRRENVFISMRNVKVDDKRGSALPQGFCKVGMKVKVSHLKVYSKSCKYEGVVEFCSSEFEGVEFESVSAATEEDKKLHFSLGWTEDVTAVISEVHVNKRGRQQPKVVTRNIAGKNERVNIRCVLIDGKPFEDAEYAFDFKVGVMIKVSEGRVDLTAEEARLYDVSSSLSVVEQNELIQWSIREEADRAAKEDFECDSSCEVTLEDEEEDDEEEIMEDLDGLEIPAVFTSVVSSDNYLGANTIAFKLHGQNTSAIVQKNRTTLNNRPLVPRDALEDIISPGLSVTIRKLEHISGYPCPFLATIDVTTEDINRNNTQDKQDHWSKDEMEELIYARSVAERIDSKDKEADRVGFWKAVRSLEGTEFEPDWTDEGFGYNESVNVDSVRNLLKLQEFKTPDDHWMLENDLGGEILTQDEAKRAAAGVIGEQAKTLDTHRDLTQAARDIRDEVLAEDLPQNVVDKLDILFRRLSKMEERLEGTLSVEKAVAEKCQVSSDEDRNKSTRDQSTQTIVTGNIMFFKYNTDA